MNVHDHVRLATLADIPVLVNFARRFHKASPYRGLRFDTQKGIDFLQGIIIGSKTEGIVLVALKEGKEIGMLVGACNNPVFSSQRVAAELGWWIEPEFRNSRAASLIYSAYEDWAKRIGCSHVQGAYLPGVSPDLTKFYQKRGYTQVESSFIKTLSVPLKGVL